MEVSGVSCHWCSTTGAAAGAVVGDEKDCAEIVGDGCRIVTGGARIDVRNHARRIAAYHASPKCSVPWTPSLAEKKSD